MKIAIVSDIHANGDALDAVAAEIGRIGPDRVYHLGDVVGYNAEPEKCVRWAMERTAGGISGNHDAVVSGRSDGACFHTPALLAARWSAGRISPGSRAYLAALPDRLSPAEGILLVHGAPSDPDHYLLFLEDAAEQFERMEGAGMPRAVFFGHTHIPAAFVRREDGTVVSAPPGRLALRRGECALMNPGSVGQPRDRDPRAAFLLYDTDALEAVWLRVAYDVRACQDKVRAARLPAIFATRLADGT